jgi:hypothetical protein
MIKCLQLIVPQGSFCNLNLRFKVGLPPEAVPQYVVEIFPGTLLPLYVVTSHI